MYGAGLTWDVIGPYNLLSTGEVRDGRLLPDGPGYQAVLVQDQAALSAEAAERLVRLAKAGLPIVVQGTVPAQGTGYRGPAREDVRVKAAVAKLSATTTVRFATDAVTAVDQLWQLGVQPDLDGTAVGSLVPVHRRAADGDAWFLYNNSVDAYTGELAFRATGAPSSLDLWRGDVTELGLYEQLGQTVTVPIRIGAGDTAVLLFDRRSSREPAAEATDADRILRRDGRLVVRDTQGGRRWVRLCDGSRRTVDLPGVPAARTVTGPWTLTAVTVSPSGDTRVEVDLDNLLSWSGIPDLKGRSGTGVYVASVRPPASWCDKNRGVELQLGDFAGAVRVWINATAIRVPGVPGGSPVDVTSVLRPGPNEIKIEVSTNLNNAWRCQALTGDPVYASWKARPELPYGLLGPVRLLPYAQAGVCPVSHQAPVASAAPR